MFILQSHIECAQIERHYLFSADMHVYLVITYSTEFPVCKGIYTNMWEYVVSSLRRFVVLDSHVAPFAFQFPIVLAVLSTASWESFPNIIPVATCFMMPLDHYVLLLFCPRFNEVRFSRHSRARK